MSTDSKDPQTQTATTLARQVSHDLRSPIAALQTALQVLGTDREDVRSLLQLATDRLKAMADRLAKVGTHPAAPAAPLENRSARARSTDSIQLSPDETTLFFLHDDALLLGTLRELLDQFERQTERSLHLVFDTRLSDADAWMRERFGSGEGCFFLVEEPLAQQTLGAGIDWILKWGLQRRAAVLPQRPLSPELALKAQKAGIQVLDKSKMKTWKITARPDSD
jgi:signal transduction histidine kinase